MCPLFLGMHIFLYPLTLCLSHTTHSSPRDFPRVLQALTIGLQPKGNPSGLITKTLNTKKPAVKKYTTGFRPPVISPFLFRPKRFRQWFNEVC